MKTCLEYQLFDILFSIRFTWFFHVGFSSNKTPKNLICYTRFIRVLFIFNVSKTSGMLFFCLILWNNVNLVLSAFRDNLFRPANLWELKTWRCFQKFSKNLKILPKTWILCRRDFVRLLLLKLNSNMLFQPFLCKFSNQLSITLNLLPLGPYLPLRACTDPSVHLWPDYI